MREMVFWVKGMVFKGNAGLQSLICWWMTTSTRVEGFFITHALSNFGLLMKNLKVEIDIFLLQKKIKQE